MTFTITLKWPSRPNAKWFRCAIGRHYIGYWMSRPNERRVCIRCGKVK